MEEISDIDESHSFAKRDSKISKANSFDKVSASHHSADCDTDSPFVENHSNKVW